MKRTAVIIAAGVALTWSAVATAQEAATKPALVPTAVSVVKKRFAVIFDFAGPDKYGKGLADSIRLRLRQHKEFDVLDRITTQESSGAIGSEAKRAAVLKLMKHLACDMAVYGSVHRVGNDVRVEARCVDISDPAKKGGWVKVFSDDTERSRPIIALKIVEAIRNQAEWVPPQYGDEAEPKKFATPLNKNGGFEQGHAGWDAPDLVSTFLVKGPAGRGTVLRVRTDLKRDPWLAYRRKLRLGQTDPSKAPKIARDVSYGSVAGLEGVHYRSEWIKAAPGQRYWLLADHKGQGGAKVFVKGFRNWFDQADSLPESSLSALGMTPEQFANLPAAKRKELIAADVKKHPESHRREVYRWYLNCKEAKDQWLHISAPFPPRGGLPKNVQWLQIQIYSYWPPGEYLWDNVHLYADPRQKQPAPVEPARTPNFDKR